MSNAVWSISYKLVEGASVPDFLRASEACSREALSKNPGFISWKQLKNEDTWVDFVTWETMEDAIRAEKMEGEPNAAAQAFYAFIDFSSIHMQAFSVVGSY